MFFIYRHLILVAYKNYCLILRCLPRANRGTPGVALYPLLSTSTSRFLYMPHGWKPRLDFFLFIPSKYCLTMSYVACFMGRHQRFVVLSFLIAPEIWVQFFYAFGTNTMTKFCIGMIFDINFDLVPISFIVSNFFARRAYREHAT